MKVIGVDPDTHGALAVLDGTGKLLDLAPLPTLKLKSGKSQLSVIDPVAFAALAIRIRNLHVRISTDLLIVLETPNRMFNEAQPLGFALKHQGYGVTLGILSATFGEVLETPANRWKARHKLNSDKQRSLAKAAELFPSHERVFSLLKHHGYAEAALIAEWGLHNALKLAKTASPK